MRHNPSNVCKFKGSSNKNKPEKAFKQSGKIGLRIIKALSTGVWVFYHNDLILGTLGLPISVAGLKKGDKIDFFACLTYLCACIDQYWQ